MMAGPVVDRALAALRLGRMYQRQVSQGVLRVWTLRYPAELPVIGWETRPNTRPAALHAIADVDRLARRLWGDPPLGA